MSDPPSKIRFEVRGLPVPQGSARGFVVKGRAIITSDNVGLRGWRGLVADIAQRHAPPELWHGPVSVSLEFWLPQPRSRPTTVGRGKKKRSVRIWPDRKPDLDKLVRAVIDSLTNVVFVDDSQVVRIYATKDYGTPGVDVLVERIDGNPFANLVNR